MASQYTKRLHDIEGREILKQICIGKGVDIGSADRPITEDVTTVDIDQNMNPDIVADMHSLPFSDNSQDFVVASHVLEHTAETISALREWLRVLKIGGKIGIMVPHGEFVNYIDLGDSDLKHESLFTEKTLELYLKHVGFNNVKVQRLERPLANKKSPAIIAFAEK